MSSRSGIIVLDRTLTTFAIDQGAALIIEDCSDRPDGGALNLPDPVLELARGRSWTSISGTSLTLVGKKGAYLCSFFRVELCPPAEDASMLALHLQRCISPEDAIHHIACSCNLTDRELEVLKGLSTGLTSKEIAADLEISPNTVKSYIRLIMVKIGVTTRSGIVGKLLEHAAGSVPAGGTRGEAERHLRQGHSPGHS